jgi:hypothetical protein
MITEKDKLQDNTFDNQSYMHWKDQISQAEAWRSNYVKKGDDITSR